MNGWVVVAGATPAGLAGVGAKCETAVERDAEIFDSQNRFHGSLLRSHRKKGPPSKVVTSSSLDGMPAGAEGFTQRQPFTKRYTLPLSDIT